MPRLAMLLALIPILALAADARSEVSLHPLFQSEMVLQRDTEAAVWGTAAPGEVVTVRGSWSPQKVSAAAGEDGAWSVALPTGPAGGPHTVTIAGADEIVLTDVLLGDVWICSGQSNMEMAFSWHAGVLNHEEEVAAAYHPRIRLFDVARKHSPTPVAGLKGSWSTCAPETIKGFSATAYYFAREVQRHTKIPIGLIGSNWGGTRCEAWTSRDTLEPEFPEFADALAISRALTDDPGKADAERAKRQIVWWDKLAAADPNTAANTKPDTNDSAWSTIDVPGLWEQTDLGAYDGVVWFRREVDVPPAWAGRALTVELGPIDDMDTTWWNGVKIGGLETPGSHATPRAYTVPIGATRPGRNVLVVRAVDTGGAGGFSGEPSALTLAPSGAGDERNVAPIPLAGVWKTMKSAGMAEAGRFPSGGSFHHNAPTALFNGMIAPLVPFGIKGAIWYQGESNRGEPLRYRRLFPAMIEDWRRHFGQGAFPFFFVQIAPFGYGGDTGQAARLREAQLLTLGLENTGMACTMDIGEVRDIHPRNKRDVGRRLAFAALAKTYGMEVPFSGPHFRGYRAEGAAMRLLFDHADGLNNGGGGDAALSCFTIAGEDKVFHPATAVIDGESIVVSSPAVEKPAAVRFAWGAADMPNLKNGDGLPASSFRTDGWEDV